MTEGIEVACGCLDLSLPSVLSSPLPTKVGTLLTDWRRINVALTRAKHKLVLVGSSSTLPAAPPLHALLELLMEQNLITDVI